MEFPSPKEKVEIGFNEEEHKYFEVKTGVIYTSCTQFLSQYKAPFDIEVKSKKKADELGISQNEVKLMWENTKNTAAVKGTNIHKAIETFLINGTYDPQLESVIESIKTLNLTDLGKIHPEKVIYYPLLKLAGTSDLLIIDKKGRVHIKDYKTNKKMDKISYGKSMQEPISEVPDSKFHGYELQLSLYAWMCEKWGLKIGTLELLWLNPSTNKFETWKCYYKKDAIEKLLEDRYNKLYS